MPIASIVTAGSRLLLGTLDRLVRDAGSAVLFRDTDSSIVPATPSGGEAVLVGAKDFSCLSFAEVDDIGATFEALRLSPDCSVWKITGGETP